MKDQRPAIQQRRSVELPKEPRRIDDLVDELFRDQDFLLSREIKLKAEELNQMLTQAQGQNLKIELNATQVEVRPGKMISWLEVKVFKEL